MASPMRSWLPGVLPPAMNTVPARATRPPRISFALRRLPRIQISPTATISGNVITRTVASMIEVRSIALFQKIRSAARRTPLTIPSTMSRVGMAKANRPVQSAKGKAIANRQNAAAAGPTGLWRTSTGPMPAISAAKARVFSGVRCIKGLRDVAEGTAERNPYISTHHLTHHGHWGLLWTSAFQQADGPPLRVSTQSDRVPSCSLNPEGAAYDRHVCLQDRCGWTALALCAPQIWRAGLHIAGGLHDQRRRGAMRDHRQTPAGGH